MEAEMVRVDPENKKKTSAFIEWADSLVITTPAQYTTAIEALKRIKALKTYFVALFKEPKQKAKAAHKSICDTEASFTDQLEAAEETVKSVMKKYDDDQEQLRLSEQNRLQAEADETARKERERLEKEASNLKTPEKREERLAQAAAVVAPVVQVASVVPTVAGASFSKRWKARLVNMQSLIDAAATPNNPTYHPNSIAGTLLEFNETAANKLAVATKGAVKIPGIEFYEDKGMSVSAR